LGFVRPSISASTKGRLPDSGIDKVVQAAEESLLPAPDFRVVTDHLRVTIYSLRSFNEMTKEERIRATYQHASLQWISNHRMTNSSLRKRFGILEQNSAMVSRLIADSVDAQLIKPFDPKSASRKQSSIHPVLGLSAYLTAI
jgi:predicted HTH transcriptional regulator